jgi:hypothetical protein
MLKGAAVRETALGIHVTKSFTAVTNGTQSMFTVTGLVWVTGIVGVVTVDMDGTTTSINVVHTPSAVGSAVGDLCAATVVTSDAAGTLYGFLGASITTLLVSSGTTAPNQNTTVMPSIDLVLYTGTIGLKGTAADAGDTTWHLTYVPISDGASVVAA